MAKVVFKSTSKKSFDGYVVEFDAGDTIFEEGDLGTEMYIIQEGSIEILKRIEDEERQLAIFEKGDFFGEMSVLEDLPRTARARALTSCRLIEINGATFDQMLRSNLEIAVRMMRKLSRRLRETDRLLQEALGSKESSQIVEVPPNTEARGTQLAPTPEARGAERLVNVATGTEFRLVAGGENTVGRRDPVTGIHPEVDLSDLDTQRSISRRHAKFFREGDKVFLVEEIGTMNGTFVNGSRLETGMPEELKHGDELRFGVVELSYQTD